MSLGAALAAHLLFGDPDWVGTLVYALIFLASAGGFVLVVVLICVKVFGRRAAEVITISPRLEEEERER